MSILSGVDRFLLLSIISNFAVTYLAMTLLELILASQSSIIKDEKIEEETSHYLLSYLIPSAEPQVLTIFVLAT